MKKLLTLFTLALVYNWSFGQWTYTASDFPAIGTQQDYTAADTVGFNPGPSGTGQTWNFASLTPTNNTTWRMVTPSTAPQAANFPNASHAWVNSANDYKFYNVTTDSVFLMGEKSIASTACVYRPDSGAVMAYPFSFGNSYNDSLNGFYADGFISSVTRKGEIYVEFDGSGTLTTPITTYSNVIRIHRQISYTDSSWTGAANAILMVDEYEWYVQGTAFPVMYYRDQALVLNGGNPQIVRTVLFAGTYVGIDGGKALASIPVISPNPTENTASVQFDLETPSKVSVSVMNISGATVRQTANDFNAGSHAIQLDVTGLSAGIYMVRFQAGDYLHTQKLIVR